MTTAPTSITSRRNTSLPSRPAAAYTHRSAPLESIVDRAVRLSVPEMGRVNRLNLAAGLAHTAQLAIDKHDRKLVRSLRASLVSVVRSCPDPMLRSAAIRAIRRAPARRVQTSDDSVLAHVQLVAMSEAVADGEPGGAAIAASLASAVVLG